MFHYFIFIFLKCSRTITPDSQGLSKPCSQIEPVTVLSKDFSRTVNPVSYSFNSISHLIFFSVYIKITQIHFLFF